MTGTVSRRMLLARRAGKAAACSLQSLERRAAMVFFPGASRIVASAVLSALWLAPVVLADTPATAGELTTLRLVLDGRLEAPAAPFIMASDRDYFRAEDLIVAVEPGISSREAIGRVAAGAADIAFADINALTRYRDENPSIDVKAVMIVYDRVPSAIVGRKSRGIAQDLASLQGKRFGAPTFDAAFAQWPILKAVNKIDDSSMTFERVGLPVRDPMLASGEVDAVFDASMASYVTLRSRGVAADDLVIMPMREYGLELYGNAIMVSSKLAAEKPDVVKRFLRAYVKGLKDSIAEPSAAIDAVFKRNNEIRKDVETARLRMLIDQSVVTAWVRSNGFGGIDRSRFSRAIDQMALAVNFRKKPAPEDVFTDAFLPADGDRKVM
jgi:NitT/TauT family transport system substrate-binding protein